MKKKIEKKNSRSKVQGSGARGKKPALTEKIVEKKAKPEKVNVVPVFDMKGREIDKFQLDDKIFDGKVNKEVLYQAVIMYNANSRQGNASTKTRGDVSGGGKKPWRQKGTGRARAGSTRSPLWRHGGVIFGPHTRDFHYDIPRKIRRAALLSSINSKLSESRVMGIDSVVMEEPKTKKFKAVMEALKLKGKSLFVLDKIDENLQRASGNIGEVVIRNMSDFNTMDVLRCDNIVMSKIALEKLPERVS